MAAQSKDPALVVRNLEKRYRGQGISVPAVRGVSFEVGEGQFYTLLGPSGCGKTTTLRCIAGLERPDDGRIEIAGATIYARSSSQFVPPHRRDIGMVFQSYAIWPHLSVYENVAFPLRVSRVKVGEKEIRGRVEEALATVKLDGYERRMATQLSGGQQQRLAVARALVRRPRLLLLDEPLSNLDAKLRGELRLELRDLQRRVGVTTVYVTHDQAEALSMSTTIAVMSEGKIVQEGSPSTIYQFPASRFVASFVGGTNFIDARVGESTGTLRELEVSFGTLVAKCPIGVKLGETATVAIRPENIRLQRDMQATTNCFRGVVEEVIFLGDYLDCRVRLGTSLLLTRQHPTTQFRPGDEINVEISSELCAVFSDEHGVASPDSLRWANGDQHVNVTDTAVDSGRARGHAGLVARPPDGTPPA